MSATSSRQRSKDMDDVIDPEPDAREVFEARMGFAFTEEYRESREWSDAIGGASK